MRNLSIAWKLIGGISVLFTLAVLFGAWSLTSLHSFKAQFDLVSDQSVTKVMSADAIITANSEMISNQRGIVLAALSKDQTELSKYRSDFSKNRNAIQTAVTDLRLLTQRDEAKALLSDIESEMSQWTPHYDELVKDAEAGQVDEANRIRKEVTAPIYKLIDKNARQLTAVETQVLSQDRERVSGEYSRDLWSALGILFLFIAVAVGVLVVVLRIMRDLRIAITALSQGAAQTGEAASQVAGSSSALASGSSQQAAALEETSASTTQVTSTARRNAENSKAATELVVQSQQAVEAANQLLKDMIEAMSEISSSNDEISKINKVIDGIAFQTNILALNAAVEAARAGEAGMGFAVVADEVRALAQRSAQAARDTAKLIDESISRSTQGQLRVDQVAASIRSITERSEQVKALVDQIDFGSQEQARELQQISRAVTAMEQVTQSTAATAEESAAAATELNAQSEAVKRIVEDLTIMVEGAS